MDAKIVIKNVPEILDIQYILEVFEHLDIPYEYLRESKTIIVYSRKIDNFDLLIPSIKKFRASYYFIGAIIARYGSIKSYFPGGCNFGKRPMDYHFETFKDLGYLVDVSEECIEISKNELKASRIAFERISVGATINTCLAVKRGV